MLQTVRIVFSKTGRAKYISHLDLNRTMTRVLRRAGVPLWYTEGFNRHPYITFAAPLSLGYEGMRESMDLRLEKEMPFDELIVAVNEAMPEGLRAVEAHGAVMKAGELAAARYRLTFDCPPEVLKALLDQPEIPVEKRTKKKTMKIVDIRPAMSEAELHPLNDGCLMEVTLPCSSEQTINPGLLLTALNARTGQAYRCAVLRLDLLAAGDKPFI